MSAINVNDYPFFKGAIIGGIGGLCIAFALKRKYVFLTILGLVAGGTVGQTLSEMNKKAKTTESKFSNFSVNRKLSQKRAAEVRR